MKRSINEISEFTGFSRPALSKRVATFGLQKGEPQDPRDLLALKPLDEAHAQRISLEQARTALAIEETALKRMQREKLEGKLVDVDELQEANERFWAGFKVIFRRSKMPDEDKAELAEQIREFSRDWRDSLGG